jgi:Flp pilus assembly protein TadB
VKSSYYERRASDCRTRAMLLAVLSTVLFAAVFAVAIHGAPLMAIGAAVLFVQILFAAAMKTQDAARYEDRQVIREHLRRRRERRESP